MRLQEIQDRGMVNQDLDMGLGVAFGSKPSWLK